MRVLFVSALNPYPPVSGGQRFAYDQLRAYASFAEVDLIAYYDETEPEVPRLLREGLGDVCRSIISVPMRLKFGKHRKSQMLTMLRSQLSAKPFLYHKFRQPTMVERLRSLEPYDLAHFDHLSTMGLFDCVKAKVKIGSDFDVEWEIFEKYAENATNPLAKLLFKREAAKVKRYEIERLNLMNGAIAISPRDASILASNGVRPPMMVFKKPTPVPEQPLVSFGTAEPRVVTLGMLTWMPNLSATLWFAENVWPLLKSTHPEVRWHIAGADPPEEVQRLHDGERCFVEGFVDDLDSFLAKCRVCAVPLTIGGGIRIKLLDMMSIGLPCVSTTLGATGLENDAIAIVDDPKAFAEEIVLLMTDERHWREKSEAGREFVRANFSPESAQAEFRSFIQERMA
ncbi:MAG: glycosyltransferase [Armatimonadetes bacterium]|nr:glycosyltransferase [Armatimonadota bacterium]